MSDERDRERASSDKRERRQTPDRESSSDSNSQRATSASSKDLSPMLKGWDFEPGTINVRKIYGLDGQPNVQTRLELGILQMELNGRPDGTRPHGHESLL